MKVTGPAVTRTTAKKREEDGLKTYRDGHNGKGPKYNKTKKGLINFFIEALNI